MQTQAPGYKPTKKRVIKGVRKGGTGSGVKSPKKVGNMNKRVRKTSAYSKNRTGVKTTKIRGYKSTAFDNPVKSQQALTNNLPGFQAPIGPPSVLL